MAKALFDASGNRALLFDTTNANESVNNQLKNECGVKRSSLITAIHRINGLQERHAADLLGVRSGVRTQYAVSTPPRSSLRPPQTPQESKEQRAMLKQKSSTFVDLPSSRLPYLALSTSGASAFLVAILACNELAQTFGDDNKRRIDTISSTSDIIISSMAAVEQYIPLKTPAQFSSDALQLLRQSTLQSSNSAQRLQNLAFAFVIDRTSHQSSQPKTIKKELLITQHIGTWN